MTGIHSTYLRYSFEQWKTTDNSVSTTDCLIPAYLSKRQGVLRGKIAKRTDERVKVMSELVNGVQVIKMYAWEKPFEALVGKLRKLVLDTIFSTTVAVLPNFI